MSTTPRTDDAFDALRRTACGTAYVQKKMEDMERELAETLEGVQSQKRSANEWFSKWEANETEKVNLKSKLTDAGRDLAMAMAELERLKAERDTALREREAVLEGASSLEKCAKADSEALREGFDASFRTAREERDKFRRQRDAANAKYDEVCSVLIGDHEDVDFEGNEAARKVRDLMGNHPDRKMKTALARIAKWFGEFPPTGKTWPDGSPTSYAAEFGSNGERDYMRNVAAEAIATNKIDKL